MLLGGRATLRPVAAARTLHSRNAVLPGLSSLRAATLASDSPPKWGFMSASRSTVMDQVQRCDFYGSIGGQCNAGAHIFGTFCKHAAHAQHMSAAAMGRWRWHGTDTADTESTSVMPGHSRCVRQCNRPHPEGRLAAATA